MWIIYLLKLLITSSGSTISLMKLHRFYYPFSSSLDEIITITDEKAHYIRNVLRIKSGRNLRIFNHLNQEYKAQITFIDRKSVKIHLQEIIKPIKPSKLNITFVQSISKGERMDYTIQKATELGINTIQPITSEFGEVKLKDKRLEKKIKHWKNISISACEQSFRADIPRILNPMTIQEYTKSVHTGIFLEPNETPTIQTIAQNRWQKFDVVIGPEGGWSDDDLSLLQSSGLQGIQFGQRILRTETMAPAILAAIHSLWGDFV
jgi:16S rRNA (uracil1498-N3)-methyltransferase